VTWRGSSQPRGLGGVSVLGKEEVLEYMLLIHGDEAAWASKPEAERERELKRQLDFEQRYRVVRGQEIRPSVEAATVRVNGGTPSVSNGPFADTREQLGGYYILACESRDEALTAASELAELVGPEWRAVELRPLG
jgi:hypothetical protein